MSQVSLLFTVASSITDVPRSLNLLSQTSGTTASPSTHNLISSYKQHFSQQHYHKIISSSIVQVDGVSTEEYVKPTELVELQLAQFPPIFVDCDSNDIFPKSTSWKIWKPEVLGLG